MVKLNSPSLLSSAVMIQILVTTPKPVLTSKLRSSTRSHLTISNGESTRTLALNNSCKTNGGLKSLISSSLMLTTTGRVVLNRSMLQLQSSSNTRRSLSVMSSLLSRSPGTRNSETQASEDCLSLQKTRWKVSNSTLILMKTCLSVETYLTFEL